MFIQNPPDNSNAILGVTGDGIKLAASGVNHAHRAYLARPTMETWKKHQQAKRRHAHAIFVANQRNVQVLI